jgi:hypothetical protein
MLLPGLHSLLRFQLSQTQLHRGLMQAVLDRAHDAVHLALNGYGL